MDGLMKILEGQYRDLPEELKKFYIQGEDEWRDGKFTATYCWKLPEGISLTDAGEIYKRHQAGKKYVFNGLNPWKTKTFNLTEQGKILRNDPALASRLQREALN